MKGFINNHPGWGIPHTKGQILNGFYFDWMLTFNLFMCSLFKITKAVWYQVREIRDKKKISKEREVEYNVIKRQRKNGIKWLHQERSRRARWKRRHGKRQLIPEVFWKVIQGSLKYIHVWTELKWSQYMIEETTPN